MIQRVLALAPLLLTWLGLFSLCRELAGRRKIHSDWRLSWMLACAAWGALLTFIVEVTSRLRVLDAGGLWIAWTIAAVLCCGAAGWFGHQRGVWRKGVCAAWLNHLRDEWRRHRSLDATAMLAITGLLILVLGVIAFATPTTNWDSQTYHLPRVLHWIQQGSIEHFPTNNTCQIEYGPWSAFVALTLHLLWGNDRWDNLPQWFAMVTCVLVGSFVAQQLFELRTPIAGQTHESARATRYRVTAFTCLLVVTLPIGIVESISTQNDYLVTAWLLGLVGLLWALGREPDNVWYAIGASLALALGVLTKATMLVYGAPVGGAFLIWWLWRLREGRLRLKLALIFSLALLVLNTPHWMRNYLVFGSPLGSRHIASTQRNKSVSVSGTFSNVIRNLALQTNTGIRPATDALNGSLFRLHHLTGRKLTDPDTTFHSGTFGVPDRFLVFDGYASNFYHLALGLIAVAILLRHPKLNCLLLAYFVIVAAGFVLFCALLRWQMWHGRIHIAWLVLLMPFAGAVLVSSFSRWLIWLVAIWITTLGIYVLLNNESRPMRNSDFRRLPREQQYLHTMAPQFYGQLAQAADAIVASGCKQVGLKLGYDDPEYAFWTLLRNRGFTGRINHFFVENESARLATSALSPCVLLTSFEKIPAVVTDTFPRRTQYGPFTLLWPELSAR